MFHLTQILKNGAIQILRGPAPSLDERSVMVLNHFSVISAGTEGKRVADARRGYIAKARVRKKEVRQVLESVKTMGFTSTYMAVMSKLESPSSLGYSCAGEVIAVASAVTDIKVGDLVACGGSSAVHAEVVAVPRNLCAKVPEEVSVRDGAFAAVASIALQGVRQSGLSLGESCLVIGLGLVGQFTMQFLHAAGVQAIGLDIDTGQVELARKAGVGSVFERNDPGVEELIVRLSGGVGVDAVIITAATSSSDPIELAGRVCRQKGRVVIVGAVPTGFSREHFYRKELDLRMSCSYGPGRYDSNYEEKGIDYPIGYVRWTENRNMQAYLELLRDRKINIGHLVTHEFDFENAPAAYDLILEKKEPFAGIVLKYDTSKDLQRSISFPERLAPATGVDVGFIGAGSFAQNFLLPEVRKHGSMVGVATARPNSARSIADKYGFSYCTGDGDEVIADDRINTLFIATRHNHHAEYVLKGIEAGKNVFVEKPLCMNRAELEQIAEAYRADGERVMVGFNRRFSPHIQRIKDTLSPHLPSAIHYRINAGAVPVGHWIHDPEVGGGRIIGEVCHFIDLAMHLAAAPITSVHAVAMDTANALQDTLTLNLSFKNGSVASIAYFSNGHKKVAKEYIEVYNGGQVAIIDDFKSTTLFGKRTRKFKTRSRDKGHIEEVKQFLHAIREGKPAPIPFEDIYMTTLATFHVIESIQQGREIRMD